MRHEQAATPQGYSIGIALLLAVWAYIGIVLNLGPGLWWQEALVAGFVTGVVVGDIPRGLSVGGTLTLLSLGLWTYGGATIPDFQTGAIVGTAVGALGGGIPAGLAVAITTAFMTLTPHDSCNPRGQSEACRERATNGAGIMAKCLANT